MNDTILLSLTTAAFNGEVRAAFEGLREGDLIQLGAQPLAASSLVAPALLAGEGETAVARGRALAAVLHWAVEQTRPGGAHDWHDRRWLTHNILDGYYFQGRRVADLAAALGHSEIHFSQTLRPRALAAVGQVLWEELAAPQDEAGRRRRAVFRLYDGYPEATRLILRILAVTAPFLPVAWLHDLVPTETAAALSAILAVLDRDGLLRYPTEAELATETLLALRGEEPPPAVAGERQLLGLSTAVAGHLRLRVTPEERRQWLSAIGRRYAARQATVAAAGALRRAGAPEEAAVLIVDRWPAIVDSGDEARIDAWRQEIALYRRADLTPATWERLKLTAGRLAHFAGDLDEARRQFEKAIGAGELATKAAALYELAELFKRRQRLEMALAYFQRGIELLGAGEQERSLLIDMLINRAMIYVIERQELPRAQADLARAEALLTSADRAQWSDLHNVWASYCWQKEEPARALEHRLQAWLAAVETQDVKRMMMTAHHLGQLYLWQKRYEEGLEYLEESRNLAREAGNRQLEGANNKTIGHAYYRLGRYDDALRYYRLAYVIFVGMGNLLWQAYLAHDLAEVFAQGERWALARRYLEEADDLAASLENRRLAKGLDALRAQYPLLESKLSDRQHRALAYVRAQGVISNRTYCEVANCAQATAARDLKDLVSQGVLVQTGQGRATRYVLSRPDSRGASARA